MKRAFAPWLFTIAPLLACSSERPPSRTFAFDSGSAAQLAIRTLQKANGDTLLPLKVVAFERQHGQMGFTLASRVPGAPGISIRVWVTREGQVFLPAPKQ